MSSWEFRVVKKRYVRFQVILVRVSVSEKTRSVKKPRFLEKAFKNDCF
jgi:hypothetical protein